MMRMIFDTFILLASVLSFVSRDGVGAEIRSKGGGPLMMYLIFIYGMVRWSHIFVVSCWILVLYHFLLVFIISLYCYQGLMLFMRYSVE